MDTTDTDEQHIVGSAEPLTPEQRAVRLQELKAWGIDLSLVRSNLQMTPTERVQEALQLLVFAEEMQRGMRRYWSKHAEDQSGRQGHLLRQESTGPV